MSEMSAAVPRYQAVLSVIEDGLQITEAAAEFDVLEEVSTDDQVT